MNQISLPGLPWLMGSHVTQVWPVGPKGSSVVAVVGEVVLGNVPSLLSPTAFGGWQARVVAELSP